MGGGGGGVQQGLSILGLDRDIDTERCLEL
jgi:hypothetical protein